LLIVCESIASATIQYTLVDLGPGSAISINNQRQIVGSANGHAVIFDSTGGWNNIDLGVGVARWINDNGRIVGNRGTYGNEEAVVFNPLGGYERILDDYIIVTGVNNSDQIVGTIQQYFYPNSPRAYFFDPVPGYPNYTKMDIDRGGANSVNNSGKIVGYRYWSHTPSDPFDPVERDWQAVIFDTTGSRAHVYLGSLPGRDESEAAAINNSDKIVGCAFNYVPPSGGYAGSPYENIQAVLFDETGGGVNTALGFLNGYVNSTATAISSTGQIVGYCFNDDYDYPTGWEGDPRNRATMFVPDGVNIDLNTVIVNPLTGWTLTEARAINDNGWIVGLMVRDLGGNRFDHGAYLLKPVPEPTTLSFLLIGALAILRRGKKFT
jgi:uncharacterized membrane protein